MCGGGDDAADIAAQQRAEEAAREAKMQAAIDQINSMFGITDSDYSPVDMEKHQFLEGALAPTTLEREIPRLNENDPMQYESYQVPTYQTWFGDSAIADDQTVLSGQAMQDLQAYGYSPYSGMRQSQLGAQLEEDFKQMSQQLKQGKRLGTQAERNRIARDELYGTSRGDIMDYYRSELDRQLSDAEAAGRVAAARRGVTGGSGGSAIQQALSDEYARALTDLSGRADMAVSEMKAADEQARLDLISRIRSGMDQESAVAGATSALQSNLELARQNAMAANLDDLLSGAYDVFGRQQYVQGYNTGRGAPGQSQRGLPTPGQDDSDVGRIYRG